MLQLVRPAVRVFVPVVSALFLLGAGPVPQGSPPESPPEVSLSVPDVPATGRREAVLTVDRYGRYSVRAESAQGTSVELIDRMAGSLGSSGEPGRENGRLDLILDRGAYKLVLESHESGKGAAKLAATAFAEKQDPVALLPETRLVEAALGDLEQHSWWLQVSERREVRAEAAGKHLTDLRLWRDGSWLEGTEPECVTVQPVTGRPLLRCRLAAVLEPGFYRLAAYGGSAQPWAEGSDDQPLWVRWGTPELPEAGRRRFVASPFGEDWFRLPDNVNFARLELPEALAAGVELRWVRTGRQFNDFSGSSGAITKESVPPAAEVFVPSRPSDDEGEEEAPAEEEVSEEESSEEPSEEEYVEEEVVEEEAEETYEEEQQEGEEAAAEAEAEAAAELPVWQLWASVTAAPGQPYVLQQLEIRDAYTFSAEGPHWVSTVHAGAAGDSIDATALVTVTTPEEAERLLTSSAIPLAQDSSWSRRFNLLGTATLFLEVRQAGRYQVVANDVEVRARVEPFLITRPNNYEPPRFQGSSSAWDLDPGFYVLTLQAEEQGIVTLRISPKDVAPAAQPARGAVRFAPIELDPVNTYQSYLNVQPGVRAGLVVRPWPLDLLRPLPVAQRPGEPLEVAFTVDRAGTLRAEAEDGARLAVSLDGGPWVEEAPVYPGEHKAAVRNDRQQTVLYSLGVEPLELQSGSPLPPVPGAAAALPRFPVLRPGAPRWIDLERDATATFLLQSDKPALYEIRSTGLLATSGLLRTRTVPELRAEESNGVGRNFLLQQYLREGDYQVTVGALGRSRGHLGVEIAATPIDDAGELRAGMPARWTLPAGRAAVWHFTIAEPGTYGLTAEGLQDVFTGRIEDADGWPVEQPGGKLEVSRAFAPGTYRLVVLPQPVDSRALVILKRQAEPLRLTGHGPHALPLDTPVEHQWVEPEGDAPRQPDLWRFTVPARLNATVSLTEEMQGTLRRVDDLSPVQVAQVPPGRSWTGELEPGVYELAAECSRRNSLVRYEVAVRPQELVAGLTRKIQAPTSLPVSVGKDGLIELSSVAPFDVRARLLDMEGRVIAEGDDRPDGWDFLLFQRLAPGRYTLSVDPVGREDAEAEVTMRAAAELTAEPLALPYQGEIRLTEDVQIRPLKVASRSDLLLIAARSKDSLGLSVEVQEGSAWRTLGTAIDRAPRLEIPLETGDRSYRLRLWSLDRQGTPVRLTTAALNTPEIGEGELRRGTALREVPGFDPPLGAAVVDLDRPGVFKVTDAGTTLRGGGAPGRPLTAVIAGAGDEGVLSAPGERVWLVREGKTRTVKAERIEAPPGLDGGVRFPLPPEGAVLDLGTEGAGPVVALATSPAGQPGVRLGERNESGGPNASGMAVGGGKALAVALEPRRPVARVWSAQEADARTEEVRLSWLRLPKPAMEELPWGVRDGELKGLTARRFTLPAGRRRVRLALGEGSAAVLSRGDEVLATSWQGGAPFEEVLEDDGAATHLTLLHLREDADPFSLELLPRGSEAGEDELQLRTGHPVERRLDRAGVLRLGIPVSAASAPPPRTLHLRGAGAEALILGHDGQVSRGADLPLPDGGTVLVRHGAGLLLAWVDQEGAEESGLWALGGTDAVSPQPIRPPARQPLTGDHAWLSMSTDQPRVLHLRTTGPVVTLLQRGASSSHEVDIHPDGARLDVYLPAGQATIGLRAVAGAGLSGFADVTTTPVTALGEGLGPAMLLPAGATRWFSFHLDHEGPLGAGVRSADDRVELDLYDAAGHKLAGSEGGLVRMLDLKPGDYLLALRAPADGPPVTARPALAGVVLPDTGPPGDVIQQYLQQAGDEEAAPAEGEELEGEVEGSETEESETAAPETGSGRES
jgi:hypothetical protein